MTKKKTWKQKGTGRARIKNRASPLVHPGGGKAFPQRVRSMLLHAAVGSGVDPATSCGDATQCVDPCGSMWMVDPSILLHTLTLDIPIY